MKTLNIALTTKIKSSEKIYTTDYGNYKRELTYQQYIFIFIILDQNYLPVQNLQPTDFTFNFLRRVSQISVNAPIFSIPYKAAIITEFISGSVTQHTNPIITEGNWYYVARVEQLIKEHNLIYAHGSTEEFIANYVEIIINSPTLDASGNGVFLLT